MIISSVSLLSTYDFNNISSKTINTCDIVNEIGNVTGEKPEYKNIDDEFSFTVEVEPKYQ